MRKSDPSRLRRDAARERTGYMRNRIMPGLKPGSRKSACKKYRLRGVITVFFALLSGIFLTVFSVTTESARIRAARAHTANLTDLAAYSLFGEYEKKLLDDYEVFGLDGACGTGDFSMTRVRDKLRGYAAVNADPKGNEFTELCFDPWNVQVTDTSIKEYALLSDNGAEPFYQQAVAFMHKTAITGMTGKLISWYRDAEDAKEKQDRYEKEKNSSDKDMTELEKQEKEKKEELAGEGGEDVFGPVQIENPIPALRRLSRRSLLSIVCGDMEISGKSVSAKDLCSKRGGRNKGTMKYPVKYSGLICDLIFREYLLEHFSCYTDPSKEGKLSYQMEYILCGKRTDKANLKAAVQKLLLLREGCNYAYCASDSVISTQAEGYAFLLVGWTGIEPLVKVLKHALLLGLSYGESLLDVRILLHGGKVPLIKTTETWQLSVENLAKINELLEHSGKGRGEGIGYLGYLRLLLNMHSVKEQKKRGLDMAELGVRSGKNLSEFRADHCIVAMRDEMEWYIPPMFGRISAALAGMAPDGLRVNVRGSFAY